MQNYRCWGSITTFPTNFLTSTISKRCKWTQTLSTMLLVKKKWAVVFEPKWKRQTASQCLWGQFCRFVVDRFGYFFLRTQCAKRKKLDKKKPCLFKGDVSCSKTLCLSFERFCSYYAASYKSKFGNGGLNEAKIEQSGDGPLGKYNKFHDDTVNIRPTKKSLRQKTAQLQRISKRK